MASHNIKLRRAVALAEVGHYPGLCAAMLERITPATVAALTARQLAEQLDSLWAANHRDKSIALADACAEGAIWDARTGALRELRPAHG